MYLRINKPGYSKVSCEDLDTGFYTHSSSQLKENGFDIDYEILDGFMITFVSEEVYNYDVTTLNTVLCLLENFFEFSAVVETRGIGCEMNITIDEFKPFNKNQ